MPKKRDIEASLRLARAALTVGDFTLWEGRYLFTPKNGLMTKRAHSPKAINRLVEEGFVKLDGRRVTINAR